jgi:hypothetical protein
MTSFTSSSSLWLFVHFPVNIPSPPQIRVYESFASLFFCFVCVPQLYLCTFFVSVGRQSCSFLGSDATVPRRPCHFSYLYMLISHDDVLAPSTLFLLNHDDILSRLTTFFSFLTDLFLYPNKVILVACNFNHLAIQMMEVVLLGILIKRPCIMALASHP